MRFLTSVVLWLAIGACVLSGSVHAAPIDSCVDAQLKAVESDSDLPDLRLPTGPELFPPPCPTEVGTPKADAVTTVDHQNFVLYTRLHQAPVRAPPQPLQ